MMISRILLCIGLAAGALSTYDTLSHSWDPTYEALRFALGPTHTNYHAFREFTLEVGAAVTMLYVIFKPPSRRYRSLWIVMAITAVSYYGGWWLPETLLGLHAPNRLAAIDHVIASFFSLAGIAMAYPHFALGAPSNDLRRRGAARRDHELDGDIHRPMGASFIGKHGKVVDADQVMDRRHVNRSPQTQMDCQYSVTNTTTTSAQPYHVQTTAKNVRDGFPYFAYHESVSALWQQKWREACVGGIYPFTDGSVVDFDPIFAELIKTSNDDSGILHRPDDYAKPFFPVGHQLVLQADDAAAKGRTNEAKDLYLRAAAVYRIARFPINRSPLSQEAWERGKASYEKAGPLLDPPSAPVEIPFSHANTAAGDRDTAIQAYLRLPKGIKPNAGWPIVLFICGLDAYKTDHTPRTQQHVDYGCATLSFEIPGTGDCPAAPNDPTSPDRLMSSVLDWVAATALKYDFDLKKVIARGISTGGYYAFRIAHTHADRLFAVVAQGGGCHHMFNPSWIRAQNQMEYPFSLAEAMAYKFGYRETDYLAAVARYANEARKFSLLDSGIVGKPTCKLLSINGMEDSIFPIEDTFIVATQGDKKDLIVRGNRGHMGNPGAEEFLYQWIDNVVAGKP